MVLGQLPAFKHNLFLEANCYNFQKSDLKILTPNYTYKSIRNNSKNNYRNIIDFHSAIFYI